MANYANASERSQLIAGLRDLAEYLESNPDVPAPGAGRLFTSFRPTAATTNSARKSTLSPRVSDAQPCEFAPGHYVASRYFGPVEYRAIAIDRDRGRLGRRVTPMSTPVLILAGVGLLSVALLGIFAAIVIGIQRGDRERRGHLFNAPDSHSDALTRRLLVGVRHSAQITEENDQ